MPRVLRAIVQLTDVTTILRIFMITVTTAFACCGLLGVLVLHTMAPQKAPVVQEPDKEDIYREVKVAA